MSSRIRRLEPAVPAPTAPYDLLIRPAQGELAEAQAYWSSVELLPGGAPAWISAMARGE
ncbi:hypothetical protein [Cellulomonas sp. URHD0024]|uniref:hypothetical protein n=1 Tax=Cellulomonas sp. URHD0024 TaxID=1302620 RepID=UPI000418B8BA|nr:hypothetical protein [Cellulomonas sp. URHD0024]